MENENPTLAISVFVGGARCVRTLDQLLENDTRIRQVNCLSTQQIFMGYLLYFRHRLSLNTDTYIPICIYVCNICICAYIYFYYRNSESLPRSSQSIYSNQVRRDKKS